MAPTQQHQLIFGMSAALGVAPHVIRSECSAALIQAYCTGDASTPNSICPTISGTPAGWFGIGGTSLSSPLWSGIIADRDGVWHGRIGNANPLLYALLRSARGLYFHDITGRGQSTNNNGLFPTTPGYDLATGIGSPNMGALILLTPQFQRNPEPPGTERYRCPAGASFFPVREVRPPVR